MTARVPAPRPKHALALTALLALALGAGVAVAKIVPQQGIAGAKLGMTLERVLAKLGEPDGTRIRNSPIGAFDYVELKYGRTKVSFDGTQDSSRVINMLTRDRNERTETGVGVGSTRAEVRQGVEGVTCANEFGVRHCYLGEFRGGETVTDFRLRKKHGKPARVRSVGIGIVLD